MEHSPVRLSGRLNTLEAHILQDALQREGIVASVRHDHLASADIPRPGTEVELWVSQAVYDRALEVISRAQAQAPEGTVNCEKCQAENSLAFGRCWQCGVELPGVVSDSSPFDDEP